MTADTHPNPRRWHGRRQGQALRAGRKAQLDSVLPRFALDLSRDGAALADDWRGLFTAPCTTLWLEIGFGKGEHLFEQALAHPTAGMIGCEAFVGGLSGIADKLDRHDPGNIRVFPGDARDLIDILPDACLDRIFLLHPDPWPKKRHAKRRFVGPDNLPHIARILKPGGEFRIGTDDPVYRRWTFEHMIGHPDFRWIANGPADWLARPADWPATRYEQKALRQGRPCVYLRFERRE